MSEQPSIFADPSPALTSASRLELPRFGVVLAGFQLVLPERAVCDFVLRAQLFSLPMAPRRLIGLVHSRGFGIPVFDPGRKVRERASMKLVEPLLIVGQGAQAGALVVDQAPALLSKLSEPLLFEQLSSNEQANSPTSSDHPVFSGLKTSAYRGQLADSGDESNNAASSLWWSLPFNTLFVRLSQLKSE